MLLTAPVIAQAESHDLFSMSLKELLQVKIVGSTHTEENLKTVPSAVTVFTHGEIKRMGLDSLDELMNLVPGFQSYRSSSSSLVMPFSSRGRRISESGSEVLILVDGQRLEDPGSSGSVLMIPKFPLANIERVEFIRGPGAAVYGSNAMMGVVNITTRVNSNEISLGYGSFNRKQGIILTSQKAGDAVVDVFGRLNTDEGDDYRVLDTFSAGRIDTDDPRKLAELNIKYRWKGTKINFQHYQAEVENFYEVGFLSNSYNQRKTQVDSISLMQEFDWSSVNSWIWLSYNQSNLDISGQFTAPGDLFAVSNPASNEALISESSFRGSNEIRTQWHNDWTISDQNQMQFGVELRQVNEPEKIVKSNYDLAALVNGNFPIDSYGSALLGRTTIQEKSRRDIIGLYTQYQHQVTDMSHLTIGFRYDDFSSIGSQLSSRLGFVHQLNNQHTVKFLYGEAFRAPSENELNLINNGSVLGNPDLKPETVQSWDLIWVAQWQQTGLSLGYFENHFQDSIIQADVGPGPLMFDNKNQDPTKGVELEVSRAINKDWLLRATYTHISEKPDLSFREADHLVSLLLNYHSGDWNASLIATYQSERKSPTGGSTDNRISLDDYWQLYGKLCYKLNPDIQAFVQVKNLLNEDYVTPSTSADLTEGIKNRGGEFMMGVVWSY